MRRFVELFTRAAIPRRDHLPLALLVMLGPALTFAATDLQDRYRGIDPSAYPDADVVTLSESRQFVLHEDGTVVTRIRHVQKVLTYEGMNIAGDPRIPFRVDAQTLDVTLSRTHAPDGREIDTEANGRTETTPFALAIAPDYTVWRELVLVHVGLEVGAIIETEYTLSDTKPWRTAFEGIEAFADDLPALERTVQVTVPAGTSLKYHLANAEAQPEVAEEGAAATYTWTLRDVPSMRERYIGPLESPFLPTLYFTTSPDWKTWSDILGKRLEDALIGPATSLESKVHELLNGEATDLDKITALHRFVVESINGVKWPLAAFDYQSRTAASVLDSSYGHSLDKAVLLTGMLREAGYAANIALTAPNPAEKVALRNLPCLSRLTHPLVRLDWDQQVLWLDPVALLSDRSQRDFIGYEGLPMLAGAESLHLMTPVEGPDRAAMSAVLTVEPDFSLKGEGTLELAGYYAPYYAIVASEEGRRSYLERATKALAANTTLEDATVIELRPSRVVIRFRFSAAPQTSATRTLRVSPAPFSLLEALHLLHVHDRTVPSVLPSKGLETLKIKYKLPEGFAPRLMPKTIAISGTQARASRSWQIDGQTLSLSQEVEILDRVIPIEQVPAVHAIYGALASRALSTVIFGK